MYLFYFLAINGVENEEQLLEEYDLWTNLPNEDENGTYKHAFLGGVLFEDFTYGPSGEIPNLKYKLRLNPRSVQTETDYLFASLDFAGPGDGREQYGDFALIQTLIDLAYMEMNGQEGLLPSNDVDIKDMKMVRKHFLFYLKANFSQMSNFR